VPPAPERTDACVGPRTLTPACLLAQSHTLCLISRLFLTPRIMLLIPAIDIKDGHCVRLQQGDMNLATTFSEEPVAMARNWVDKGARRVHLVDLNGAFAGQPKNELAIRKILKTIGTEVDVQLGGGIRDLDTIERYLDAGLRYVIIGTAAVRNPGFLQDACTAFGGHIIVGLDAKDGKVATDGWSKLTRHDVVDLGKKFEDFGVESIIYTDIGRDGMLTGINIDATVRLAQALSIPVIASGGLSGIADIEALCAVEGEGIEGVICGRAIYSGDLDFEAAQVRADELSF
jgi:phosphoribosylformimino-5-aminoimidazole carboxamide ribotide isomerase